MQVVMDNAREEGEGVVVGLEATEAGKCLYEKLGFEVLGAGVREGVGEEGSKKGAEPEVVRMVWESEE